MDSNRWEQIQELFNTALQLKDVERGPYLAKACGSDADLRAEVASLINSLEGDNTFLQRPVFDQGLKLLATNKNSLSAGDVLGTYRIVSELGVGGMGVVYLAHDPRLGRNVALKLLAPALIEDKERVRRFKQEARVASKISHPNVAAIYEIGTAERDHFIAMEYVEGVTLREHTARGPLPLREAIDIALQTAAALKAAHTIGIVHRDIKPENIMIRSDGYVKVLDFGLAKLTEIHQEIMGEPSTLFWSHTEPGRLMGTVTYMSPEQARSLKVDERTDLWSLGVVLYELLTGKSPFLADTHSDTIAAILKTEPPPIGSLCPGMPAEIERVVTRLLSKSLKGRYPDASGLIADLSSLPHELTSPTTTREISNSRNMAAAATTQSATPDLKTPMSGRSNHASVVTIQSSADRVISAIKRSKLWLMLLLLLPIAAVVTMKLVDYSGSRLKPSPIKSIAVLPLHNGNGDPNTEYLSDGLSESLIERFSRLSQLKVIGRNSSFKYKGKAVEPKEVARELGAQALVLGNISQTGDELLVQIELVDPNAASPLWSGQYRYKATDLPLLLNEVSRQIAGRLNLGLSRDELSLVTRDHSAVGNAYDLYMKGRFYWNQLTEDSVDKSIEYFNEALERDPQYALAYAGLANSYFTLGANYRSPEETFPKAELYAQKALELDGDLAEAHYAEAQTKYVYWDLPGAEQELRRALELNPNYAGAHSLLCSLSLTRGDTKQALIHIRRALDLDPLSLLFNTTLGYVYYFDRDNKRAIEQLQKTLNQDPSASFLYNDMAKVYAQMRMFDEALASTQRATILLGSRDPDTLSSLAIVYAMSGKTADALWVADTLEKTYKAKYVPSFLIASIYGALGDKDRAFSWLAKASQQRSSKMLRFRVDPIFDKIRSDPRYDELLRATHLD